jgi:AAA domain/Homeodomain-like domain
MSYEQVMSDRLKRALIAEGGNLQYIDDDLKEYYHQSKRKFLGEVSPVQQRSAPTSQPQPEPPPFTLADADEFLAREIPPRQALLTDAETGSTVLYEKSLNQIFAYRGIGKSVVANSLIKVLTQGGEFLRFRSDGGLKTVLVDGELPAVQLQERLKEFSGTPKGLLKILSPELLTNPKTFPVLSVPAQQAAFIRQIEEFGPRVLIFDTLTRCFKFDTNDPDAWLVVNDFLLELRFRGYCVVLIHHAGKNGTQRGRTDGDDNLDISVILSPRYGWQPGDGLEFKWTYEKVRHGGHLPDFEAEYHGEGRWQLVQDDRTADVIALAKKGKSQRGIGQALDISQPTVNRILRKAHKQGLIDLNEKHGQLKA